MELKQLISPRKVISDQPLLTDHYGRFYAEPLERGFGVTIGNALRRILLSSIQGCAVSSVRIEDINHEFTHIEGVKEDISDIILNLKSLVLKMNGAQTATTIYLDVTGPKVVMASDFELNPNVEILTPDQHIATLAEGGRLNMEANVQIGRGYVAADDFKDAEEPIGLIPLDADFSPVKNVAIRVEDARVGQRTDYDRLILDIWTSGTVRPDDALSYAAQILRDHLNHFITIEDDQLQLAEAAEEEEEVSPLSDLEEKLDKSIEELELSVRSFNCLEAAGIKTIRDLVQKSEAEMLKYRNFGRKSLTEIKNILKEMGLSFNMKMDEHGLPILDDEE